MPDDSGKRRKLRTITTDEAADRARAHDQRRGIPIRREDDTVPLGRPPGVPRTVTRDLRAECRAAWEHVLVYLGATPDAARAAVTVIDREDGVLVCCDFNLATDEARATRLVELAANLPPVGGDRG